MGNRDNIEIIDINMLNESCYSLMVKHPDVILRGVRLYLDPVDSWVVRWDWGRGNSETMIVSLSDRFKEELELPILKLFIPMELSLRNDRKRQALTEKITCLNRRQQVLKDLISEIEEQEIPAIERSISRSNEAISKCAVDMALAPDKANMYLMPVLEKSLSEANDKLKISKIKFDSLKKESDLVSGSIIRLQGELYSLSN